ncbi:MAG: dUTP diphosphatase [Beijerinckiaceae bacterium]
MNGVLDVRFRRWAHAVDLAPPAYQSAGAAGLDLVSAQDSSEQVILAPGERKLIPTGFSIELPAGFEAQVRPRSGLAFNHGVTVLNAPGTIDSDYRGEIKVLLVNFGQSDWSVERGMRIAQLVVAPVVQARVSLVDVLQSTERGQGGFGSTGTKV